MKIQMFKAIDSLDNELSLFLIHGDGMRVSTYFGEDDPWLDKDWFTNMSTLLEPLDNSRMIDPILMWES